MPRDEFSLTRFVDAQEQMYASALAELKAGRKRSHWIWFVFPQLRGLGFSAMSERYGISGLAEARAYLAHPVLGPRLRECVTAMLTHAGMSADAILGDVDALKFRSCLTLFAEADPSESLFTDALARFFGGERDARTVTTLERRA
ncbi:MAG: DUF1810 domain-containing protein [Acidobacteria bacterium]|nr:DUF1810 domain-containing protein [Acidobacteriota bacterium]